MESRTLQLLHQSCAAAAQFRGFGFQSAHRSWAELSASRGLRTIWMYVASG